MHGYLKILLKEQYLGKCTELDSSCDGEISNKQQESSKTAKYHEKPYIRAVKEPD